MSLVPQLEHELVAVARRAAAPAARGPRFRRRLPLLVAAVLLALALGAVALAASGVIGGGEPLKPPAGSPHDPRSGLGVLKPGSPQLLHVAVPDPGGGPPWGLRFVKTTRGLGCLQVGRVVDGRLGVLGQDGAFNDDRRFHPLAENYFGSIAGPFPCGTLDANGHTFAAGYMRGVPASGLVVPNGNQVGCLLHRTHRRGHRPIPACPRRDLRDITVGMAGPEAESVTYRSHGRLRTVPTVGDRGAYLIVQRISARSRGLGTFIPVDGGSGGGAVVRIRYRDGSICRITSRWRVCPPVGQVLPASSQISHANLASPITARIGKWHSGRTVVISFVARRAVTDASAAYVLTMHYSGRGRNCHAMVIGALLRNVRAGQRVHIHEPTNGCRGIFHGTVAYSYDLSGSTLPAIGGGGKQVRVGAFTVDAR